MRYCLLLYLFLLSGFLQAQAQRITLQGTVQSATDTTALPSATVVLQQAADANAVTTAITNASGRFRFEGVAAGKYNLLVNYLGFKPFSRSVEVIQTATDVGVLALQEEANTIKEVVIVGQVPAGEQKGDTTQFNAGAFKTGPDASTEDLVQKMPGITIQDGRIQAQGEDVQEILIDGKPFFGNDVNAALQNLPAEVVASVQVFDRKSDKAELSGFDDGERIKSINIVTKPETRKGQFGKVSAGYGSDDRHLLGASVNFFKNDRKLTVTGLRNNVNSLSFSADPNNEADSRTQDGIIKTNALGLNFTDAWLDKIDVSASYTFNRRQNEGVRLRVRDFVLPSDSGQVYTENSRSTNVNADHRFNMRLDYEINENNRIRVRTRGNAQQNESDSYFLGNTATDLGPLNRTENTSASDNSGINFNNNILYSHRFLKKGRSFSTRLNTGFNNSSGEIYRLANSIFYSAEDNDETLRQYTNSQNNGFSWETNFSFTEPIGQYGQIELEYEIGNRLNDADRRIYDFVEQTVDYSQLKTFLSNTFKNEYLKQETELGYRYNNKKLFFQVEAEYQHATLKNNQQFPADFYMERTFTSVLPSARLRYKFSDSKNFELNYDTRTNAPSVGQLQNVIDNSNPLQLRTGNPNLRQAFRNWFRAQYRSHNRDTDRTFYASVSSSVTRDFIASSTAIADRQTMLSDDVVLERGSQLIRPVNLNGNWDVRSYFNYGQPLQFVPINLNLNGSVNHSQRPGLINNELNSANTSNFRAGIALSSNISERIDFTVSTNASYNIVENTLRPALNNNFYNQWTRLKYNWIFGDGFVYRTNMNHQFNSGLSEGYDNSAFLWNMSIGKKLFNRGLGEISLNVYDLLKQNNNIRRNVTELYVEDVESNVLQRYFMLTFTYNIRNFGGGGSIEYDDL